MSHPIHKNDWRRFKEYQLIAQATDAFHLQDSNCLYNPTPIEKELSVRQTSGALDAQRRDLQDAIDLAVASWQLGAKQALELAAAQQAKREPFFRRVIRFFVGVPKIRI
jgi:hypothetical protein